MPSLKNFIFGYMNVWNRGNTATVWFVCSMWHNNYCYTIYGWCWLGAPTSSESLLLLYPPPQNKNKKKHRHMYSNNTFYWNNHCYEPLGRDRNLIFTSPTLKEWFLMFLFCIISFLLSLLSEINGRRLTSLVIKNKYCRKNPRVLSLIARWGFNNFHSAAISFLLH